MTGPELSGPEVTGPQELGLAVLGCADIAERRALPAIRQSPFRLVAVASRTQERAARFAARFGGWPVVGYSDAIEMPGVEAVYIPLPNSEHAEWTRRALAAGKHVLVEKPAVPDPATARVLVALAEQNGLLVMENFAFLRHPQYAQARALLDAGAIGDVRSFSAAFGFPPTDYRRIRYQAALGGGSFWEAGCYPIRAAQEYLATPACVLGASLEYDPEVGVDTAGAALLRDGYGVTAHCTWGFVHSYRSTYEVWGSQGRLVVESAFTPDRDARPLLRLFQEHRETIYQMPAADQFAGLMAAFCIAIRDPAARSQHHEALVRQAELMAAVRASSS